MEVPFKTDIQFLIWKLQALLIDSYCDTTEFQNKFQQPVQETMKNGLSIPFQPFTMCLFLKFSPASVSFFLAQKMSSVLVEIRHFWDKNRTLQLLTAQVMCA